MKKTVLIIIFVIVVAIVSGGVVYFLMSNNNETNNELVQNNTQSTTNSSTKEEIYIRSYPIKSCVITYQSSDGSHLKYREKCESCGYIGNEWEWYQVGIAYHSRKFYCSKCGKYQEVLIQFSKEYK